MGCDIHLHTEIKVSGKWEHYGNPSVGRNYNLFGKMAGVRDRCADPISEPKGLPSDVSIVTRIDFDRWSCDAHSASYLNADEILVLQEWYEQEYTNAPYPDCSPENQWGYYFGNSWGGFRKYPGDGPSEVEDVRFVFWFDN